MEISETMEANFYGLFNKLGFTKATKTKGAIKPGEIQIQMQVLIPIKAFKQTVYRAKLEILEADLPDIVQEFEMKLNAIKKKDEEE